MGINRTDETTKHLEEWVTEFERWISEGMRSMRAQWNIEGHDEPLTLYANGSGVFIVEPGQKPTPANEWLNS